MLQQPQLPGYGYSPPALFNNQVANAQASADQRYNQKALDRPGMSRGAGSVYHAGIAGAQAMADGIAAAYSNQADDAVTRATGGLAAEQGQEQYAQALGALQQQNAYANAMSGLQRFNALMGLLR